MKEWDAARICDLVHFSVRLFDVRGTMSLCVYVCVRVCVHACLHPCVCMHMHMYIHVCLLHLFYLFFSQRSALSVHGDQIHCADCCHLPVLSLRGKKWAFVLGLIFA